jgi:hypothetical protein
MGTRNRPPSAYVVAARTRREALQGDGKKNLRAIETALAFQVRNACRCVQCTPVLGPPLLESNPDRGVVVGCHGEASGILGEVR